MLKKFALSKLFILSLFFVNAQSLPIGWWRAVLEREDGNNVVFNFESKKLNGKQVLYVRNPMKEYYSTIFRSKAIQ